MWQPIPKQAPVPVTKQAVFISGSDSSATEYIQPVLTCSPHTQDQRDLGYLFGLREIISLIRIML